MKQSNTEQGLVKNPAGRQVLPAIFLMTALIALYFLSAFVPLGRITFYLSVIPLIVIIITALARLNDISSEKTGWHWHVRRFGLILAGLGAAAALVTPLASGVFPTWREVMLEYGIALTWFTTPGMPPWWRFIAGKHE